VISGIVNDRHALVNVIFRTRNRSNLPIEFLIDTGFTDQICLPLETVTLLGLRFRYAISVSLADGSEVTLPVHEGIVIWNGAEQRIRVLATGIRPLLGTALLEDCELIVHFKEGGMVKIAQLHDDPFL
jgi:clan AA aspartic protease